MRLDATRLTQLRRVSAIALAPDGTWLAVQLARLDRDEKRYVSDLWRLSLADPDAPPHQLTRGDWNDSAPRFRRDGALAFVSDRPRPGEGEDERRRQVWILPAAGGEPLPLTDEPLGVNDFRFARDADRLAVLADVLPGVPEAEQRERARDLARRGPSGLHYRSMPVRFWDRWLGLAAPHLVAYDERGGGRRDLTPEADREYRETDLDYRWDLSRDGKKVVLPARRVGRDRAPEVSLHLIDLDSGQRIELGREDGATYGSPTFSPDGERLAAFRHLREPGVCGRITLQMFAVGGGAAGDGAAPPRPLAADWDVWPDVEAWTEDGRALVVTADVEGQRPVFSVDASTGEVTRLSAAAAGGVHGGLVVGEAGGAPVAYGIRHTLLQPPEPFRLAVQPDAEPALLANLSGLAPEEGARLARWESFEVEGADGERVQSFLIRPADGPERPPVLMFIHGGPIGQHVDGWHWRWNPLVATGAGYAVALPNPRGSTGRGQAFIEGVWNNRWGGDCYLDLMAVADALERRPDVDGARMAALGGSFGGYMANWIGGQTERFRCLVTHASIYHFPAFHGATDEPAYFALELGGTPYGADPAAFERYSPHRFIEKWKTPTLVIHGEKDYRVPVSEALLLFEALQLHGVESELLIFPDENHWILKPQNSRQWYDRVLEFVARYV